MQTTGERKAPLAPEPTMTVSEGILVTGASGQLGGIVVATAFSDHSGSYPAAVK
jgi:hypothetical protein